MRSKSMRAATALSAAWLAAITIACASYDVRQSSLVPVGVPPPPPPPQPIRRGVETYVGDRTITFLSRPELAPNERAGLWIPRTQLGGSIDVSWPYAAFRTTWLVGLSEGAMAAAPTTLPNPGRAVYGLGPGVVLHATSPTSRVGVSLGLDTLVLAVPSYIEATCTGGCEEDGRVTGETVERHQRDAVGLMALTVTVSWRYDDALSFAAQVATQNHPTNLANFTSARADAEVDEGPMNLIVGSFAELRVTPWLSVIGELQWPVTAAPVRYGPILGLGLRASSATHAPLDRGAIVGHRERERR